MSLRRAPWLLLFALVCCADEPLTQIVVVVDSDYDGFTRVDIEVGSFDHSQPVRVEHLDDKPLPRRLALVHDGGPLGPITVTVRAYVDIDGVEKLALREPRTGIDFESGKTRMLKIDLLFQCVMQGCDEACIAPAECVTSEQATRLQPWDSKYAPLDVVWKIGDGNRVAFQDGGDALVTLGPDTGNGRDAEPPVAGGGSGTSGSGGSREPDASTDASVTIDAGPPEAVPVFTYVPSNFDPGVVSATADERPDVALTCPLPQFSSKTLEFTAWCGAKPLVSEIKQADGSDAVLLVMNTFSLDNASTLQLSGDRPIILAVFGDAQVFGMIDLTAFGEEAGPGALASCGTADGSTGPSSSSTAIAAGGGSGGGFGSVGARSGAGGSSTAHVDGGTVDGNESLSPLRGGCPGGRGGSGDGLGGAGGGGGGAIQISAAGSLQLIGKILAGGGGGRPGSAARDGGGGGGSGGAILLEGASVAIDSAAIIAANGGGGAGGQPSDLADPISTAGLDALIGTSAATGGEGSNSGGNGGTGAWSKGGAGGGEDGMAVFQSAGGGGGGGGGAGRIRINGASDCMPPGALSPPPSIQCPTCSTPTCPMMKVPIMPMPGCTAIQRSGSDYHICTDPLSFDDARAHCATLNSDLVHIDDQSENTWVTGQLASANATWAWIGASDAAAEGQWRWLDDDTLFWYGTASGMSVGGEYNAWLQGSTPEPNTTGDCARTEDGAWLDSDCATPGAYVCE